MFKHLENQRWLAPLAPALLICPPRKPGVRNCALDPRMRSFCSTNFIFRDCWSHQLIFHRLPLLLHLNSPLYMGFFRTHQEDIGQNEWLRRGRYNILLKARDISTKYFSRLVFFVLIMLKFFRYGNVFAADPS